MAIFQQQFPGQWTEKGLESALSSGVMEEVIVSDYPNIKVKKEIDTVLRYYAQLLKNVGEKKEASEIEGALIKYYKK